MKVLTWEWGRPVRAGPSILAQSGSSAALELRFLDFITLGGFNDFCCLCPGDGGLGELGRV